MKLILGTPITEAEVSPEDIAWAFCLMDDTEQARFFNHSVKIMSTWTNPFVFQLAQLSNCKELTDEARNLMREIGNYSQKTTP